jgi:hypothetical protein
MVPLPINLPSMRKEYGDKFDVSLVPKGACSSGPSPPAKPPNHRPPFS